MAWAERSISAVAFSSFFLKRSKTSFGSQGSSHWEDTASIARPAATASTQPRRPQPQIGPFGSANVCPICPAIPFGPVCNCWFNMTPPPTPVETVIKTKFDTFSESWSWYSA